MQYYHDHADTNVAGGSATEVCNVEKGSSHNTVDMDLAKLRLDYGLDVDMMVGDQHKDQKSVNQEYISYTTQPLSEKGMDPLKFWEVHRMWRMGNVGE